MNDRNARVVAEFNETHGGNVHGFEGKPLLLLHAIGAKSGEERMQPLMYLRQGDGPWYIFASYGGAPKHPQWYHNVVAHPDIDISVGDGTTIERVPVHARVLEGEERAIIYAEMGRQFPQFARYEEITTRDFIPVVELARR